MGGAAACGTSSGSNVFMNSSAPGASTSTTASGSTSATQAGAGGGSGSFGQVTLSSMDSGASDAPSHGQRCNDAGCTCFSVASIGHRGVTGSSTNGMADNTTEFINWLNTESSTTVDLYETKPTLDAAFLGQYDVLIIQWLADGDGGPYWQFSPDEVNALGAWVNAGGGLITLSGFEPSAAEVGPLNTVLSFSDISYNPDDVLGTCAPTLPCTCWGGTVPVGPWTPGPIGNNITQVGAYRGRSINPGSATVDASGIGTDGGVLVYAAHEAVGNGHIFAWADEWVTYTSQWLGIPQSTGGTNPYTDPTNMCYQQSASQVFQVPQFWYNAIAYASSATSCSFTINNNTIIPR